MESVSNTVLTITAVFITVSNMYNTSLRIPQAVLNVSDTLILLWTLASVCPTVLNPSQNNIVRTTSINRTVDSENIFLSSPIVDTDTCFFRSLIFTSIITAIYICSYMIKLTFFF